MTQITLQTLESDMLEIHSPALTEILVHTVKNGAAIGFIEPFTINDAQLFWEHKIFPKVRNGERLLFAAFLDNSIVGTVQLEIAMPANQPHRCEVAKMMVHPSARRQGIGKKLMLEVETTARKLKKKLITLDTRTGDVAQPLYASVGFLEAGIIPDFALDTDGTNAHSTTYMYKALT